MANDLSGITAKLDRAEKYIPLIAAQIKLFLDKNPYRIWEEEDKERGGRLYKVKYTEPIPEDIRIDAGTVIQLTRSALDNLCCALALRNIKGANTRQTFFPITASEDLLLKGKNPAINKIKLLSQADRDKIVSLKPYLGGNDLLYALHELRRIDYHNRLINTSGFIGHVGVINCSGGFRIGGDINTWGMMEDERTIIWFKGHVDFDFSLNISFHEVGHTEPEPIPVLLKKFITEARRITAMF